jgi:hypothetical protein
METRSDTDLDRAVDGIRQYRKRLERAGIPRDAAAETEARMLQDLGRARKACQGRRFR